MTAWADFALHTSYTHTWMAYVAGLPRLMDYPELLALRAPLTSLVQSSRQDPLYTAAEVSKTQATLEAVYRKAWAADHFRFSYHEGPHRFDIPTQEEAFSWLDSWIFIIKPVFLKELKALFTTLYPGDAQYLRLRNFYRFYLSVYTLLFLSWQVLKRLAYCGPLKQLLFNFWNNPHTGICAQVRPVISPVPPHPPHAS